TIGRVRESLNGETALIGFAGAPWTVACYMLEGHGGTGFQAARDCAINREEDLDRLTGLLTDATIAYLKRQAAAGADAVQIFDSWAGLLPRPMFDRWVTKPTQRIVAALK